MAIYRTSINETLVRVDITGAKLTFLGEEEQCEDCANDGFSSYVDGERAYLCCNECGARFSLRKEAA